MTGFYTIKKEDVGKSTIRCFNRVWLVQNFLGQILPCDIGKRVYRVSDGTDRGILQAENQEQLEKRLGIKTT